MVASYQSALASKTADRAQQYWDEYLEQHPDSDAKRAYQQAFQERFGRPVGGLAKIPFGAP